MVMMPGQNRNEIKPGNVSIKEKLLNLIKTQFKLNLNGDHGIKHWSRVAKIGDYLS